MQIAFLSVTGCHMPCGVLGPVALRPRVSRGFAFIDEFHFYAIIIVYRHYSVNTFLQNFHFFCPFLKQIKGRIQRPFIFILWINRFAVHCVFS